MIGERKIEIMHNDTRAVAAASDYDAAW